MCDSPAMTVMDDEFDKNIDDAGSDVVPTNDLMAGEQALFDEEERLRLGTVPEDIEKKIPNNITLYLACFHLPIDLSRKQGGGWNATWNTSLIAKGHNSAVAAQNISTQWVGTVGLGRNGNCTFTAEEQNEIRELLATMNCTPIFVEPSVLRNSYLGYCKEVMWPTLHNIDANDHISSASLHGDDDSLSGSRWRKQKENEAVWWDAYCEMNRVFASHMENVLGEDDVMWVHDYHLMLLPKMVTESQKANFGYRRSHVLFFMHVPFPTCQILRALPQCDLLLEGVLCASVVGFHAFDQARHFLIAGKRQLGLTYQSIKGGLIGVEYDGRTVMVVISHAGIERDALNSINELPITRNTAASIKDAHPNRRILCGIEICQKLSGIGLKLLAFEKFLTEYPTWAKKVVLVQYCLLPSNREEDEKLTSMEVNEIASRIKKTYGKEVLDLKLLAGSDIDLSIRLALFSCSDVFITCTIREGLNLLPLEYIVARKEDEPGVVLASEFSTCVSVLNGAIRINPFNLKGTAETLDQALTMNVAEKISRRARDISFITTRPGGNWTYEVLNDMWNMYGEARVTHMESGWDLVGRDMRLTDFIHLPLGHVRKAYKASKRRVIMLDYGGTLLARESLNKYVKTNISRLVRRKPTSRTLESLQMICTDAKNTVFVISGLHSEPLLDSLGSITNLGLGCNNGHKYSWPVEKGSSTSEGRHWEVFDYGVNWDEVRHIALPILEKFTAHTNGSFIKTPEDGLAWNYVATDPEWGQLQGLQLGSELEAALRAHAVKIQYMQGQVELVPTLLHKGIAGKAILQQVLQRTGHCPDFILCCGDDIGDECLFSSVYSFIADFDSPGTLGQIAEEADNLRLFLCTVGKKPSNAMYYLENTLEVENLIAGMASMSNSD